MAVAFLLLAALVLQVVGSLIVVREVWDAHRRWVEKFRPQSIVGHVDIRVPAPRVRLTGRVGRVQGLPLDERVTALEEAHDQAASNLIQAVNRLEDEVIPKAAEKAASEVQLRLEPVIRETLSYLAGLEERPGWRPWWLGPLLLLLGTLLSGGVAVVAQMFS